MKRFASRVHLMLSMFALLLMIMVNQSARAQTQASVISYNIGETTIIQSQFAPDSRFYDMPVRLQGVLAVPSGNGPFPVALILHGAYPFCTAFGEFDVDAYPCPPESDLRQYEGFTYLAQALAERGYIAIVPDLSAEFNNGFAEPIFGNRTLQIAAAHLDALAIGTDFGIDVAGKSDFTRLVIAGHSRGGPLAIRFITDASMAEYPVAALAMLTPAYFELETIPPTLPVALVTSECDGDVGTEEPLRYLEIQLPPLRPALTTLYTFAGGTHNAFSTQLSADLGSPCAGRDTLAPAAQRAFAAIFLTDFFDMALRSSTP